MRLKFFSLSSVCLALLAMLFFSSRMQAQAHGSGAPFLPDRFQVYAGYGYWDPIQSEIYGHYYQSIRNLNTTGSLTYFVSPHWGVEVAGSYFSDNRTAKPGVSTSCAYDTSGVVHCEDDQIVNTADIGAVYRMQFGRWVPFAHLMGGGVRMNGPVVNPAETGWEGVGGVGVDYVFKFWNNRLAIRPIQADAHVGHVNYGPIVLPAGIEGGSVTLTAVHLSAGLVLRVGGGDPSVEELTCSADPGTVYPGDVVHLAAVSRGMGRHLYYTWTAPNLKDGGGGASAFDLPTTNLAPGNYEVTVRASNGPHHNARRSCHTSFQIHPWDPPSVACKAQPDTVDAGTAVNIVTDGRSPQNRPLTYTYATSAGAVTGAGPTVSLATDGAAPGAITVTCTVADDLGQTAQSTATVNINQPPPPPPAPTMVQPMTMTAEPSAPLPVVLSQQPLCSISFDRDRKRPTRVDNEAKACLDSVALSMGREAQNKLVVVGTYAGKESMNTAAERAMHTKEYLTQEKGIDPNAIDVMIKASTERSAESVLLPPGATFEENGTVGFDPSSVHMTSEAYGKHSTR